MALHLSKHISILGSLFLYLKTCIICIDRDTWPSLFTNYSHFSQTCTSSTIFFQLNYQPVISVYQSVFIIPYIYLISRHLSVMLIGQKNTSSHVSFLTYPPKYQKYLFWSIGQLGQKYLLVCSKTNCLRVLGCSLDAFSQDEIISIWQKTGHVRLTRRMSMKPPYIVFSRCHSQLHLGIFCLWVCVCVCYWSCGCGLEFSLPEFSRKQVNCAVCFQLQANKSESYQFLCFTLKKPLEPLASWHFRPHANSTQENQCASDGKRFMIFCWCDILLAS